MLFGLRGGVHENRSCLSVLVLPRSTLFLPGVPLPLLEMREAINAKERDGAVVLVGVMRVKVDANVPIKVTNRRRWMKRLETKRWGNSH
jgi:hypothetical protein